MTAQLTTLDQVPALRPAPMRKPISMLLSRPVLVGLLCGAIAVYAAAVGLLAAMQGRWIIVGIANLSQVALLALGLAAGAKACGEGEAGSRWQVCLHGIVAGIVYGAVLAALLLVLTLFSWRSVFINFSPDLRQLLAFHQTSGTGLLVLIAGGGGIGLAGGAWRCLTARFRRGLLGVFLVVLTVGALQQLLLVILQRLPVAAPLRTFLFVWDGLTLRGAATIACVTVAIYIIQPIARTWFNRRHATAASYVAKYRQALGFGMLLAVMALLPVLAGSYISQVLVLVGLYTLMGMGLNIEAGLAGLLDLGFVAFFAVGAYSTALLTADSPFSLAVHFSVPALSFWQAMPVSVMLSIVVGIIFGIPVLGVRGDYLAIATLGLGEIIRVIVLSDMAAPLLGGAQGILQVPKPSVGQFEFGTPVSLFYLTFVCSGIAAYVAWRLQRSRLGRAWMALRDDEAVAQSLGINLVKSKLLAYGMGAAFAGLAGSIFAAMLGSIYPNSFTLIVSINILALVVVGGLGSIQGVVLGAILLVGLPELFREFGDYRFLFYGIVLIVVMIRNPDGLWPATRNTETGR